MPVLQPAGWSESATQDPFVSVLVSHIADKKMAPRLRRGPAVECKPLQALQQGAGERIPVAGSTLGHLKP